VQFCAPSDHEIDASRIYCRSGVDERDSDIRGHHG